MTLSQYAGFVALGMVMVDWGIRSYLWWRKRRLPDLSAYDIEDRRLDQLAQISEEGPGEE